MIKKYNHIQGTHFVVDNYGRFFLGWHCFIVNVGAKFFYQEMRDSLRSLDTENIEDLAKVIGTMEYHQFHCNLFPYSYSKSYIYLIDLRQ